MPWIGSLGVVDDLSIMFKTACYERPEGHEWDPSEALDWWTDGPVASSPTCHECRMLWRDQMRRRGLEDEQIKRLFARIGAPWRWKEAKDLPTHRLGIEDQIMLGVSPLEAYRKSNERRVRKEAVEEARTKDPAIVVVNVDSEEWTDWHEEQNRLADLEWERVISEREKGNWIEFNVTRYRNVLKEER